MAASQKFPPVEGFLQKRGGGRSLLGSKAWNQRYVRIEGGSLAWWKKKEDAAGGAPPQKGARLKLNDYYLEIASGPEGKYYCFSIVLKDPKAASGKLREKYEFRVHEQADLDGWAKIFRVNGCVELGAEMALDSEKLKSDALEAAAPKELLDQLKALHVATEPAPAPAPAPQPAATAAIVPAAGAVVKAAPELPAPMPEPKPEPEPEPKPEPEPEPAEPEPAEEEAAEEEAAEEEAAEEEAAEEEAAEEEAAEEEAAEEEAAEEEAAEEEAAEEEEEEEPIDEDDPNSLWRAYADEDGDLYYVNRLTQDSVWECPEGFTRAPEE